MKIAVIDGQGGGIGKALVERIKKTIPQALIIALGTNAVATGIMLKAGADKGATGDNAIIWNSNRVDIIIGAFGIIAGGSMMGELSDQVAAAVSHSDARKILIPLDKCGMEIAGVDRTASIQKLIELAVEMI
ncbi:MAG: DUF3842 family protein [Eubacteriales bacterium]|nr:DUF3842 family protein [Eubacteriales bacterium]MDD4716789.1 DUF3842 family protein [Eubacteriales bacterium]